MALDGTDWVKLKRPLTDAEMARQLKVSQPQNVKPDDHFSVFAVNDVFLETTDASFHSRGVLSWGGLAVVFMGGLIAYGAAQNLAITPEHVGSTELAVGRFFMGFFVLGGLAILLTGLWMLSREMFTWTRRPVRFNRQSRMIYAFRGVGTKNVISVPWDKAFFYVQEGRDSLTRAYTYNIRCHVLDDAHMVAQSFSVGNPVVSMYRNDTEPGQKIAVGIKGEFEYIRQYMEKGLAGLPGPELVPSAVSFGSSMQLWLHSRKALKAEGNALASTIAVMMIPLAFFYGTLNYIGRLTSREPRWPADVDDDCRIKPIVEPARA
ncbi:DUF6708 domain-containing protein [Paraburkholderia graminis]|uniref:DUF6708 domain-containing protein n=1 Tax=Paraburkholderia graminis TaxID=60548 RepID=UPI000411DF10